MSLELSDAVNVRYLTYHVQRIREGRNRGLYLLAGLLSGTETQWLGPRRKIIGEQISDLTPPFSDS